MPVPSRRLIDFEPHRFDGTTYIGIDPYSRDPAPMPSNLGLTPDEVNAIHEVLRRASGKGPDQSGNYQVALEPDLSLRFYARALPRGCTLAIEGSGVPLSLAQIIFDLLVAGNWVARHVVPNGASIATSLASVQGTSGDFGPTVVVESVEDLHFILLHGLDAFQEHTRGQKGITRWK